MVTYPPIPSRYNLVKLDEAKINIASLKKNKTLNDKILTKKQLLLKKAKGMGMTFDKNPSVLELEKMLPTSPVVKKSVPVVKKSPPVVKKASPVAKKASPVVKQASPAARKPQRTVTYRDDSKFLSPSYNKALIANTASHRANAGRTQFFSPRPKPATKLMRTFSSTRMEKAKTHVELDVGPCGYGPRLAEILQKRNITKKKWDGLPPSIQMKVLKHEEIVNEDQIIDSFFKQSSNTKNNTDKRPVTGVHNKIREHFVCTSLYQISKNIRPKYTNKKVLDLFDKLKSQFEENNVVIVDAKPAGGQGNSHDFEILLNGADKYSTVEFKATQTKCANEEEPWSCTPQFFALQLKHSHLLKIPNEGDAYLRGWYAILKKLDADGQLFTPPGSLPPYTDYLKDVYKLKKPDSSFVKEHIVFWKSFYEGMRGRGGDKVKIGNIDKKLQEYTNEFLKKNLCNLDLNVINRILKERITKKDFWITWTATTSSFKLFKGMKTAFVGGDDACSNTNNTGKSDIKIVHPIGKRTGFDKYKLRVSGIYSKKKNVFKSTYITINIYWGNRTMNPYWHFSSSK